MPSIFFPSNSSFDQFPAARFGARLVFDHLSYPGAMAPGCILAAPLGRLQAKRLNARLPPLTRSITILHVNAKEFAGHIRPILNHPSVDRRTRRRRRLG
jgi:hypothetical protein